MSDVADCVRRLRAGDRRAFDRLFRLEGRRLYNIALRILRDPALAEDATQETFVRVIEGRAPLREEKAAARWLGRVAARVAVDIARREGARRRREARHAMEEAVGDRPEKGVLKDEQLRLLSDALKTLSPETRAALWLHIAEGEGVREVAQALDSSRSTVSRRVQAGLAQLRSRFRDRGYAIPGVLGVRDMWTALPEAEAPATLLARLGEIGGRLAGPSRASSSAAVRLRRGAATGGAAAAGAAVRRKVLMACCALALAATAGLAWLASRPDDAPRAGAVEPPPLAIAPAAPAPGPTTDLPEPAATPQAAVVEEPPVAGRRIEGRVVDFLGNPIAGAQVTAFADPAAVGDVHALLDTWGFIDILESVLSPPEALGRGATDSDGRFRLGTEEWPGLAGLVLVATKTNDREDEAEDEGETLCGGLRIETGAQDEVSLLVGSVARATGRVTSTDGSPLEGALVSLIPDLSLPNDRDFTSYDLRSVLEALAPATVSTRADGSFEIVEVPMDRRRLARYRLLAAHDGHAVGYRSWEPEADGPVRFVLERGIALPGHAVVTGIGEEPAAGARVVALGGGSEEGWFAAAVSDEVGELSLTVPEGASFVLIAKMPGRATLARRSWQAGVDSPPLVVEFAGAGAIEGRILLPGGAAVKDGVRVLCRDLEGAFTTSSCRTDASGRYRLEGAAGPGLLHARSHAGVDERLRLLRDAHAGGRLVRGPGRRPGAVPRHLRRPRGPHRGGRRGRRGRAGPARGLRPAREGAVISAATTELIRAHPEWGRDLARGRAAAAGSRPRRGSRAGRSDR